MAGQQARPRDETPHRWTIDRCEGDLAVVEDERGRMLDLPRWLLPAGAGEGDVVVIAAEPDGEGERRLTLRLDHGAAVAAREAAESILARLRARDPGGDIEL